MAKYPSEEQERFIVRMPDGMRERIRAAADASNRSMNAEIIARLEQSLVLPTLSLPTELIERIKEAPDTKKAEASNKIVELLLSIFPALKVIDSVERYYELSLSLIEEAEPEIREELIKQLLNVCRNIAKDPQWQPSEAPEHPQ